MKILITGITGLMGSYLARQFSGIGELHGLRRQGSKLDLLGELAENIVWHEGDVGDYTSLEEAFEGMDLIIHAAGMVSYAPKDSEQLIEVNVTGTANVVNVMLQKDIGKLIFISSVAALGRNPGIFVIDEKQKWSPSPLNTPYGISKYLAELEVWRGAQEGLKVMVFSPSVLLGKHTDQRSSTRIYDYILQGNKYYPTGNINYIDVRDAAKLVAGIHQTDRWNERFILNKESITYKRFFEEVALAFQKKAPSVPVSGMMLGIFLFWQRVNGFFNPNNFPISSQAARLVQQNIIYDNGKVTALKLGEFTPLRHTLGWAAGNSI